MDELVDSLEALGHTVLVNGRPDDVLPMPPALAVRVGRVANSAPIALLRLVFAWFGWRRRARRSLADAGVRRVLVWDPLLVLVARATRPRAVEILWVPPTTPRRRRDRIVHAAAKTCADTLVSAPLTRSGRAERVLDEWVVFGSSAPLDDAAREALRRRAAERPAAAVVFDGREHDPIGEAELSELLESTRAGAVWSCGDDEWVKRLGGLPALAVDPTSEFAVDHRHVRALSSGGRVLRHAAAGWTDVSLGDLGDVLADERQWAEVALGSARA